jgi:hypothetical protein
MNIIEMETGFADLSPVAKQLPSRDFLLQSSKPHSETNAEGDQ